MRTETKIGKGDGKSWVGGSGGLVREEKGGKKKEEMEGRDSEGENGKRKRCFSSREK